MKLKNLMLALFCLCSSTTKAALQDNTPEECKVGINGELWLDTNHKPINAHGGNVIYIDGRYYWYGENRPYRGFTTTVGIEVYSSTDLLEWKDEGVALAVSQTPGHDIERGCIMERPKVIHNPKTGKYVMLFHLELKGKGYEAARVAFAESDSPVGPFRFVRSTRLHAQKWPTDYTVEMQAQAKQTDAKAWKDWWTPEWRKEVNKGMYLWRDFEGGQMSRDMTVFVDDDGKAYHITSSQENLTLLISELTDDYMDFTGKYITVAPGGQNEAPTIVKNKGKYWMICSGCTGWDPNEARMFVADNIWGPWQQLRSPFRGEEKASLYIHGQDKQYEEFGPRKTFGCQGTYILSIGNQQFFMADRWNPRHLSHSLHVWLPIKYNADGPPVIEWVKDVRSLLKQK